MIHCPPLALFEFSSLPMLGWLAAAVLPWLIHRWHRQHHRTTSWAAIDLLLSAMQQRARRVQMQQWLLLAVRTAILVLVALAVAEPALRQWAVGASGRVRVHRVIVIDQSHSMASVQAGTSRWQRAQDAARQWVRAGESDPVTVIGWADQAENLLGRSSSDSSMVLAAIDELGVTQQTSDLPRAIRAALAAIERAEIEVPHIVNHHVMFVSDLGRRTWQVGDRVRALFDRLTEQASVSVVNVAGDNSRNVAVTDLRIAPAIALRQRPSSIRATIHCFGSTTEKTTEVALFVDGERVNQRQVELSNSDETTVSFEHAFVDEGAHTVRVSLVDNADDLATDDQRWQIIEMRPRLRIACFAGQPGSADDLIRALEPSEDVLAEKLSLSRLAEIDLPDYDAILLAGVGDLSAREGLALTEYVRQGGGLAVFPGAETTGTQLASVDELLPATLVNAKPVGEYRIDPLEYQHPVISLFRGQSQAGLLGVTVSQYFTLRVNEDAQSVETVMALDSGDPALIVGRFGLGRVAVSALPCSLSVRTSDGSPWSSIALSPSFLPVVRELVNHLIGEGSAERRNLQVGDAAIVPWLSNSTSATVRLPSGVSKPLPALEADDRQQLRFSDTTEVGVYQLEAKGEEVARLAVNLNARESDLSSIDPSDLPAEFSIRSVEVDSRANAVGGELAFSRLLLTAAAGLLLLEIGLAYLLGKGWG